MKTKGTLNFVIDVLLMLDLALIAGIGFLIKFTLLPGRIAALRYGSGASLSILGLDRHEWGAVHLYASFVMLGLIVLHIVLHWRQIVGLYRNTVASVSLRRVLLVVYLAICAALFLFAFVIEPDIEREREPLHKHRGQRYAEPAETIALGKEH